MILQPALKVSVSNTAIYHFSTSIGLGLMWQESRPQTAPPSSRINLLLFRQISLYVKKVILSWCLSFRGLSPCSQTFLPVDSEETLSVLTERRLLDQVSIGISPVSLVSSPLQSKWLCRTRASCSPAKVVLSSEEASAWNIA